jgi:hypothetical protein
MTLSAGSRLGPYEIVSPLGAGGMGRSGAGGMGEGFRARWKRASAEPEWLHYDSIMESWWRLCPWPR